MINLQQISLLRGQRYLFRDISFTLHDKHKIGLVGANGAGKSSLFALLLKQLEPTEGQISYQENCRLAHVAQETPGLSCSAMDYVLQGDVEFDALQTQILAAEQAQEFEKLAVLHNEFAAIDGYAVPSKAAQMLTGLGFSAAEQQQTVASFSGGWRMRLNLAQALLCRSDALLLDEPTNHLDLTAILWLEKWLQSYSGLLILISHDRDFLDRIVDEIIHINQGTIKLYSGNYSSFETQRAQQLILQRAMYEKQQRKVAHIMKYVNRFRYKSSKAKQAQSRLKAISHMEMLVAVQAESAFEFEFYPPERCPYPILNLQHANLGYAEQTILSGVNLQLIPGDRVALLGPNGAGKSTLLKSLIGELPLLQGKYQIDNSVKMGYFAQHQLDSLDLQENALYHLQKMASQKTVQELRNFLGRFGFSGDTVLTPVTHFSGGEKARLVLAMIVWQKPNLLLLDEPTNHLDLEMRMALTMALQSFDGALVLVSHDRHLIRNTVDQLLLVADGTLSPFNGDLDDYATWVMQYYQEQAGVIKQQPDIKTKTTSTQTKKFNAMKIQEIESKMAKLELQLQVISEALVNPALYDQSQAQERNRLYKEQERIQDALNQAEAEWIQYHESE